MGICGSSSTVVDNINYDLKPEQIQPNSHAFSEELKQLTLAELTVPTSHNSYLWGAQNLSPANVKAIKNCLLCGARCLELDVWTSKKLKHLDEHEPIVAHGTVIRNIDVHTTTQIRFDDCIKEIASFETTDPIFISFELIDGESVETQNNMAKYIEQYFPKEKFLQDNEKITAETKLGDLCGKVIFLCGNGARMDCNLWKHINFLLWTEGFNFDNKVDMEKLREEKGKVGRIYPSGSVAGHFSMNYDVLPFLKEGVTFAALNYQGIREKSVYVKEICPASDWKTWVPESLRKKDEEKQTNENDDVKKEEPPAEKEKEEEKKPAEDESKPPTAEEEQPSNGNGETKPDLE